MPESLATEKEMVVRSGLFDREFYLKTYPDVLATGEDPLDHYLSRGQIEGRKPSAFFDPKDYFEANPDLDPDMTDPLLHYIHVGQSEQRPLQLSEREIINQSDLFDWQYYGYSNPDVIAAEYDLLDHYLLYGRQEGRNPSPDFDAKAYLNANPDLDPKKIDPFIHYIRHGKREGRPLSSGGPRSDRESDWVIPFLSGSLGNQLFQISACYALARRTHAQLGINYSRHGSDAPESSPSLFKDTLYRKIRGTDVNPEFIYKYNLPRYKEIPRLPDFDMQVQGHFQSGKYFEDFSEEIRRLYVFPDEDVTRAAECLAKNKRATVGICLGGSVDKNYYIKALSHFPKDLRFVVCSNEPAAALDLPHGTAAELFPSRSETADMALLMQCTNLILSNSAFSWWACYLGSKKEMVTAPSNWFNPENHDIHEKEWIII